MKQSAAIMIFFLSVTHCFGQSSKEKAFIQALRHVVAALSTRDSVILSRYIDGKTGVYILNRIGVLDTYKHYSTLGFSDTTYPNAPFYDKVRLTAVSFSTFPTFDCKKWTKTGTFVDTTQTDHLLSKIAKNVNKEFNRRIPSKRIDEFYRLETNSRRIVIAANNGNELIFYLSYINDRWMLTIIDKATTDCSV